MPRLVFVILFLMVAAIPVILFAALNQPGSGHASGSYRSGYSRGSSFFFIDLDGERYGRGRGYSTGGYQGGGLRSGK